MRKSSFERALRARVSLFVTLGILTAGAALVTCSESPAPSAQPAPTAVSLPAQQAAGEARLQRIRETFPGALGPATGDGVEGTPEGARAITVTLPADAAAPVRLADERSGVAVTFALEGAARVPMVAPDASGYALYPAAAPSGGDVLHRPHALGDEDFVYFAHQPESQALRYHVDVSGVPGLRLVSSTLEFLDLGGAPRLRVAPPAVVDASGRRFPAELAIGGCAADVSPRAPWGRPVTAPGASSCVVTVSWAGAAVQYPVLVDPQWMSTSNNMITARWWHAVAPLPNPANGASGTYTALVTGGFVPAGAQSSSAELYDPITRTFAATGSMNYPRAAHTATPFPLTPTLVLVAGGSIAAGGVTPPEPLSNAAATTEIYDQGTGMFTVGPTMSAARFLHTATALVDGSGRILLAGGTASTAGPPVGSADLFTPAAGGAASGTIAGAKGLMQAARFGHAAALLSTGAVLITGGIGADGPSALSSAETFCPPASCADYNTFNGDTFEAITAPMTAARAFHTAIALAGGEVLLAGGVDGYPAAPPLPTYLQSAELYSPPPTSSFAATPTPMAHARAFHTATALVPGFVLSAGADAGNGTAAALLAGGYDGTGDVAQAEVFFPASTPSFAAPIALVEKTARRHAAATLVNAGGSLSAGNGVLITGGITGVTPTNTAELLLKPTGDPCLGDGECASGFCADQVCCNIACNIPCYSCAASLKADQSADGTCGPTKAATPVSITCTNNEETHIACTGTGTTMVSGNVSCGLTTCGTNGLCSCFCDNATSVCAPNGWCNLAAPPTNACAPTGETDAGAPDGGALVLGTCEAKQPSGQGKTCTADEQCGDATGTGPGFCYDGYCCNVACGGQCQACDLPGNLGTCTNVGEPNAPVKPHSGGIHPRAQCGGVPTSCGGACNGLSATSCNYPNGELPDGGVNPSEVLHAPDCTDVDGGTLLISFPCDGDGGAITVDGTCGGYFCLADGGGCNTSCKGDSDCIANYVCTFPNPNAMEGVCQVLDGPLCDGHTTLRVPTDGGKLETTCADHFACPAGATACAQSCEAETECAAPFACDAPHRVCVRPLTPPPVPSCTACTVAASDPGSARDAIAAALGALAAVVWRRRRRG